VTTAPHDFARKLRPPSAKPAAQTVQAGGRLCRYPSVERRRRTGGAVSSGEIMSKRETIERIQKLNPTARPDFLESFHEEDLLAYLRQLAELKRDPRGPGSQWMARAPELVEA
jgi:hypothetical protein